MFKRLLYKITLLNSVVRHYFQGGNWPWWNRLDDDIIVGALPLQGHSAMERLKKENVSAVLSIVEPEELESSGKYINPMRAEHWKPIPQEFLSIPDYHPIEAGKIKDAIEFIERHKSKGPVYVHCKAGRGRSIVIAACYLLKKHPDWTPEMTLEFIQSKRPHICPNKSQIESIQKYYNANK